MPKGLQGFQKGHPNIYGFQKGHKSFLTEESKRKIGEFQKGRKMSEESKKKLSLSRKGIIFSEEQKKKIGIANSTHTLSKTRFYKSWQGMRTRCYNPNDQSYNSWGGRGITVCDEWLDFQGFYDDMFPDYCEHAYQFGEKETTIERIDVNGNYNPNNCRWATWKEQANNTRNSCFIKYKGKKQTIAEWAREFNIKDATLRNRIKRGKSIKNIFRKINSYVRKK